MATDKTSTPTTPENTSTSSNKFFFGWWVAIAAVFLNIFQGGVLFYGFTVVILPMTEETGWSRTVVTGVSPSLVFLQVYSRLSWEIFLTGLGLAR